MNIPRAIEVLTLENKHPWNKDNSDLRNAVKLGIEALTFLERWRNKAEIKPYPLLPSESTD